MTQYFDTLGIFGLYLMAALPVFLFMMAFVFWGQPKEDKPATISRKKVKKMVRKATNTIPTQFRRYDF